MEKDVSKKIIDQIKQENIQLDPAWKANWKSYLFWALLVFVVLLSSAFFSLMLLSFVDFDFELLRQLKLGGYFRLLMVSAPYLWVAMLALTIILGFHVFRKTKKGYRYSVLFVAGIIFLVVSILGVSAHFAQVGRKFNDAFAKGPVPLRKLVPPGEQKFFEPEKGIISGVVIEKNDSFFTIETLENGRWEISYDDETHIRRPELVEVKESVIIVGEKTGQQEFDAAGVKPMKGPGRHLREEERGEKLPPPQEGRARERRMMR